MGVRGARRGNTAQQVENQVKNAADALLAAVKLLKRGQDVELSANCISYFAAVERRAVMVRDILQQRPDSALIG